MKTNKKRTGITNSKRLALLSWLLPLCITLIAVPVHGQVAQYGFMNPAAPRSAGASFDNEATLPGGRIAAITSPVQIIHAKDNLLQLYHNAEFATSIIPGSKLMSYKSGGHILMAVEEEAIRTAVRKHILGENDVLQVTEN